MTRRFAYGFILPLIALIYAPRLLNFLSILENLGIYGLMAIFLLHTFCFAILIGTKYTDEWRKNCAPFVQSYFTSLFAPCIVMSPESKLLLFSNLLSTIPHVVVTAVMVAISSDENLISSLLVKLIPWLLISPMFAWLLQAYSQEKTQEILVNGINFKLVKFFSTMFVLRALDEVSDILTAMDYFK